MRRAGKIVAEMHEVCSRAAKVGATTADVDAAAREVLQRRGARSNFLGYHGFPAVVCTSPNQVIVHGIPSDTVVLAEGDILSIDCGAIIEGWHADAAVTVPIREIDDHSKPLIDAIQESVVPRPRARGVAPRRTAPGRPRRSGSLVRLRASFRVSRAPELTLSSGSTRWWRSWPSPKMTRSWSREGGSNRSRTPCSVSSLRM